MKIFTTTTVNFKFPELGRTPDHWITPNTHPLVQRKKHIKTEVGQSSPEVAEKTSRVQSKVSDLEA